MLEKIQNKENHPHNIHNTAAALLHGSTALGQRNHTQPVEALSFSITCWQTLLVLRDAW